MLLPTDEGGFTVPVGTEAPAVPSRVELLAARQLEISTAIGHGPALSESELTFTKGYPQRRAAQLAAGMISQPAIPQLTTAADVAKNDVLDPRFGQGARIRRSAAASRPRIPKHGHVHDRYSERSSNQVPNRCPKIWTCEALHRAAMVQRLGEKWPIRERKRRKGPPSGTEILVKTGP